MLQFGGMELPNHLQKVVLKIVSNHICDEMYAKIGFSVSNSMICAVAPKGDVKLFYLYYFIGSIMGLLSSNFGLK